MWIPGNYSEAGIKKANNNAKQASSSLFSKTHSIHNFPKTKSNNTYLLVRQKHWRKQYTAIHKIESSIFHCLLPSNNETSNNTAVQEY